jgi:DNA ligase D-like protein (predicted ligase)
VPGLVSKRHAKDTARFVEPMQCLPVAKLPEGPNWEYEVKFDGYRALGIKSGGSARLLSRNGNDLAARFPILAQALAKLPDETSIDGELVALDETGRPSFNVLQNYRRGDAPLQFYAFDVLTLAGRSLQGRPLEERRKVLRTKILTRMPELVLFSETLEATASEVTEAVKAQGLEGVIAKRRDSLYEPGRRSGAWVKMRVNKSRELMVGGYVPNGKNFDSIVVGFYERDDLVYVARVRNGFTPSLRDAVFKKFRGLETPKCPFVNLPQRDKGRWGEGLTAEKMVECRWLKPRLTAQIEYAEWTDGNHLRHSKFAEIRDHKDARDLEIESPTTK